MQTQPSRPLASTQRLRGTRGTTRCCKSWVAPLRISAVAAMLTVLSAGNAVAAPPEQESQERGQEDRDSSGVSLPAARDVAEIEEPPSREAVGDDGLPTAPEDPWSEPEPVAQAELQAGTQLEEVEAKVHAPPPAIDTNGPAPVEQDAGPWVVGGFVDTNYIFNHNLPDNHLYRGTATQPRTGEASMNLAGFWARHEATPGQWSWTSELGLQFGPAAEALVAAEPIAGGAAGGFAGPTVFKHVPRANAGFRTPRGTEITAGLMTSPIGIGVHWVSYNNPYSVTWELNGVPYYLGGVRLHQPLDRQGRHALQAWVVNGWQIAAENNSAPSGMLGYLFTPSSELSVAQYLYAGPEQSGPGAGVLAPRFARVHSDTQASWEHKRLGLGGLYDVGAERSATIAGEPMRLWMAGAIFFRARLWTSRTAMPAYARARRQAGARSRACAGAARDSASQPAGRECHASTATTQGAAPLATWDLGLRPEVYWDRDGAIYGVDDNLLLAVTATQRFTITPNVLIRVEYRYDHSTAPDGFFYARSSIAPDAPGLARDQHTVFFNLTALFETRLPRRL